MPNWTKNQITCNKRLADILLTKKDGKYILDFNKLLPMPKELNLTAGSIEYNSIACYYLSLNSKDRKDVEESLKGIKTEFYGNYWNRYVDIINKYKKDPSILINDKKKFTGKLPDFDGKFNSLEELGKQYFENIKNYNCSQWYDWCATNWGTKWNVGEDVAVYVISDDCYEIKFYTAWAVPLGIVKKFSENCNDGELNWKYVDEDFDGYHQLKLENGKIVDYVTEIPNEYAEEIEM